MRICQHKYDHRAREDQRSRAAPDARRQTGEPSVERPARDRSDARREQSLKKLCRIQTDRTMISMP